MISVDHFWTTLVNSGFFFYSGVPCSILKPILENIPPEIKYIPAVREDSALGVCSGARLAGKPSVILIQNSGLGNIVNALTSFNLVYKVPVLLIITWRGEPGKKDAPEHDVMGEITTSILEKMGISYQIIDDGFNNQIKKAKALLNKTQKPVALILREGVIK